MKSITIKDVRLHPVALPLVEPLRTSFGVDEYKTAVLLEVITEQGISGWGEASVNLAPGYGPETMVTGLHVLQQFAIPLITNKEIKDPSIVPVLLRSIRGHKHTVAGLEAAIWDACAKVNDMRLADYFATFLPEGNQPRTGAVVGVSIGIQPSVKETLQIIEKRLAQGYKRIKLKIKRGWDIELAQGVREALPTIMLMLDANSDYTLQDSEHLKQLDQFDLLMIEQPLAHDDIYQHSKLQQQLDTPLCLDESIHSVSDLQVATELGALNILNLKPARVGGFTHSLQMYKHCVEHEIGLWIGGMLETGVGRATNVAFAALPGINLPSDISATDRYFDPDITEPRFELSNGSQLAIPDGYGIGVEVDLNRIADCEAIWEDINPFRANHD